MGQLGSQASKRRWHHVHMGTVQFACCMLHDAWPAGLSVTSLTIRINVCSSVATAVARSIIAYYVPELGWCIRALCRIHNKMFEGFCSRLLSGCGFRKIVHVELPRLVRPTGPLGPGIAQCASLPLFPFAKYIEVLFYYIKKKVEKKTLKTSLSALKLPFFLITFIFNSSCSKYIALLIFY